MYTGSGKKYDLFICKIEGRCCTDVQIVFLFFFFFIYLVVPFKPTKSLDHTVNLSNNNGPESFCGALFKSLYLGLKKVRIAT